MVGKELKREGPTTCQIAGRRRRSLLKQGGREVCVHVRTITLGGRLRGYPPPPPKSLVTPKMGVGRFCEHGHLPRRIWNGNDHRLFL